jgi:hypothetical protein
MIPLFPEFKKLDLSDKAEIEAYTEQYPPYSDFEFVSLWSWNIKEDMEASWLHGNLVVRFTDYVMGNPFYTFLGDKEVNETATELLKLSEKNGYGFALGLVPEVSAKGLDRDQFDVYESREHFDYIYEVERHLTYSGGKLKARRNFLNGFLKQYSHYKAVSLDLSDERVRNDILDLCRRWEENKGYPIPNEAAAHKRFLDSAIRFNYVAIGITLDEKLIGYCTTVLLPKGEANALFEKVDIGYHGIHALLRSEMAKVLHERKHPHLNYEQDLGIESLRKSKMAFDPTYFLKKYSVSLSKGSVTQGKDRVDNKLPGLKVPV